MPCQGLKEGRGVRHCRPFQSRFYVTLRALKLWEGGLRGPASQANENLKGLGLGFGEGAVGPWPLPKN